MSTKSFVTVASLMGLVVAAFSAGGFVGRDTVSFDLPRAQAMTALSDDSFAVCTTSIDGNIDGVFMLDFETGDLTGGVLNQNTAKFTTSYRYNVLNDLGFKPGQVKEPRFLIVPGRASFAGNAGNRMAQSVLYVTDVGTGVTVAYGIPWSPQQASSPKAVMAELIPLDIARPRGGAAAP